jgi:hypothetical protein
MRLANNHGREDWEELAELASQEQDPEKLMALVAEINRLLEKKDNVAKAYIADGNPEIIKILKEKQALQEEGSTKPDAK